MLPQDEIVVATTASAHLPAAAIETITELVQRTKLDPLPTTPAGLVSRESFLAAIRGRYAELSGASSPYDEGRRNAYGAMECLLGALPSAELPAIGVSECKYCRGTGKIEAPNGMYTTPCDCAALRPAGEDRG